MNVNNLKNTGPLVSIQKQERTRIILKDFQPLNSWKVDVRGDTYENGIPFHIIDQTTNRKYLNESKGVVAFKCFLLALGTPLVHIIASLVSTVYLITKVVTFSHFRIHKKEEPYAFLARLGNAGKDVLKIVATPISLIGLELAALYGIFKPYDGRKLYASIERARYGNYVLAPCFQPNPSCHLFGGDMNDRNAY